MLIFLIILLIIGLVAEIVSLRQNPEKIDYESSPSVLFAEPDERFEVITVLKNKGWMPFNYIRLVESLPAGIKIEEQTGGLMLREGKSDGQNDKKMTSSAYLFPRQRLERRVYASLPRRGRFFFRGAFIHVGDLIGIKENTARIYQQKDIVIFPKRAEDQNIADTLGGFMGDISVTRFILEDPVLILGFREYTGSEPMKNISWNQTARSGQMMVKRHDYTLEPSVSVVLNTETEKGGEVIERCFSIARTVCETLEEKAIQYNFITNATTSNAIGLWSEIPEGLGAKHLSSILEGLGRAGYETTEPFADTVEKLVKGTRHGRSYIIITPSADEDVTRMSERLKNVSGGSVCILEGGL